MKLFLLIFVFIVQTFFGQSFNASAFNPKVKTQEAVNNILDYAKYYHYNGKLDRAINLLDDGLKLIHNFNSGKDDSLRIFAYKGRLLTVKSFITNEGYDRSVEVLEKAKNNIIGSVDASIESDILLNYGFALYAKKYNTGEGSYEEALKYFEKAMHIRKMLNDNRRLAESYIYTGIIYERMDNIEKAREFYLKADSIAGENNLILEESYSKRHLAFLNMEENLEKAHNYFLKSLKLREEIGYKVYLPFSYLSVGTTFNLMKDYDNALEYLGKAELTAKKLNANRILVLVYLNIGDTLIQKEENEEAAEVLNKAKLLSEKIGFERGYNIAEKMLDQIN